jgi:GT2 family glycosyltransferase
LATIAEQKFAPFELIIVDDSPVCSAGQVVSSFVSSFELVGCRLKYVQGSGEGLTASKNLGVTMSKGDVILFLDDDTLLHENTLLILATFLKDNHTVIGVQPRILSATKGSQSLICEKLKNAVLKALMLIYRDEDRLAVRRSGMSVFPRNLSKTITAQRLYGCCCYRRRVFRHLLFDTNLKRWGFMEDLDFSYGVYKHNLGALAAIPDAIIIHKSSREGRLSTKKAIYMQTIYWFYVFFKDVFQSSTLNLIAFLWALAGNLIVAAGALMTNTKKRDAWSTFVYLLGSYAVAFRNLGKILALELDFFNKNLSNYSRY